jgi:competence ComEA-like helix-hairpin-helix protein
LPGKEIKELKKIANRMGFTSSEARVILFICLVFLTGLTIKYFIDTGNNDEPAGFDYSKEDSTFNYYRNTDDSLSKSLILSDKKVDYERELLDFSENELSSEKDGVHHLSGEIININTADSQTLTRLPGIGIKTAEKIIELRLKRQRFNSVEELLEVKGIGKKKLDDIREFIIVE